MKTVSFWSDLLPKSWDYLKGNYSTTLFKKDLFSGITVGVVALPLAMAFAIASGLPPERGLFTAIIAGFLISLLGGSRFQIGGPTGAFVVIVYGIVERSGYEGLVVSTLLAGVILLIAALLKVGYWIRFIPYPLVIGFTTGIALNIFSSQVKDFLGLQIAKMPADFIPKWMAIFSSLSTTHFLSFGVALGTLLLIIGIRRFIPSIPWGIASVILATIITFIFGLPIETIQSRFGELPRVLPLPCIPSFSLTFEGWDLLVADAFTIAFLAGIESLLSAMVADGMTETRHKPNAELLGQGFANIGSIFFGGIPATGAIARTVVNIKSGGQTPVAGMIHAITLFLILLSLAPLVSQIPLAALSAVLMMVAWNMSELEHFIHLFRGPKGDIAILLTTFFLTVFVDLNVAVAVGMVLAAFIFMKRMGDVSGVFPIAVSEKEEEIFDRNEIPQGIEVYELTGPFFFGVVDTLTTALSNIEHTPKVFILQLKNVPVIDSSGMHALKEFALKCEKGGTKLYLTEVSPGLRHSLKRYGLIDLIGKEQIFRSLKSAIKSGKALLYPMKEDPVL